MTSIDRFHPHVRHAVGPLRLERGLTMDAVLDGHNTVIMAPEAAGALELATFSLLSRILTEDARPVAVVCVRPTSGSVCDRDEVIRGCARMVGLEVTGWHGQSSDGRRKGFQLQSAHVAMTTPESLEAMLINARARTRALLGQLSAVMVDEVHEFADDDRGAHLAALLERIREICGRDFQRVGLSAPVGNPEALGQWLRGSSGRPLRLTLAPKVEAGLQLHVDFCDDIERAADGIAQIARGKKSLVFLDDRSEAERIALGLNSSGIETSIRDGSVTRADGAATGVRTELAKGEAIICLSAVAFGIETPELDQVVQVVAPSKVSTFLQRLGRNGRGESTRPSCTCFCLTSESLLQSMALLRLAESGWVEDARTTTTASNVLAHQVIALVLQDVGIPRQRLSTWIGSVYSFSGIQQPQLQRLIDTMKAHDILHESNGVLSLGQRGERQYGRPKFFELYADFAAPAQALSAQLCRTIVNVLLTPTAQEQTWLSRAAAVRLAALREAYAGALGCGIAPLEILPGGAIWHTFAGGAVNRLLALGLERTSGTRWIARELSVQCRDLTAGAASAALAKIADLDWEAVASDAAESMARGLFNRLQPCLPEEMQRDLATECLLDIAGTSRFVRVTRVAELHTPLRGADPTYR